MPDTDERVATLLQQLVDLQKAADERQRRQLLVTEQYYVDARKHNQQALEYNQQAIELYRRANGKQKILARLWLVAVVFMAALLANLVVDLFHQH